MWYLLLPAALAFVGWLVVRAFTRRSEVERAARAAELAAIARFSAEEAEREVVGLLTNAEFLRLVPAATGFTSTQDLPLPVLALLQQYEAIETSLPPWARIARDAVAPSATQCGFVRIGTVGEGTDTRGEVCVSPDGVGIRELYEGEPIDLSYVHPTIFHWFLAVVAEGRPRSVHAGRR
jgi:hypothetical protein